MDHASRPRRESGASAPAAGWQPEPRELHFLYRATSTLFADPGDYGRTLDSLGRLLVPEVCDWCAVDLTCDDGSLARVAVHHADPARQPLADELRLLPPATGPLDPEAVVATGQPEVATAVGSDPDLGP